MSPLAQHESSTGAAIGASLLFFLLLPLALLEGPSPWAVRSAKTIPPATTRRPRPSADQRIRGRGRRLVWGDVSMEYLRQNRTRLRVHREADVESTGLRVLGLQCRRHGGALTGPYRPIARPGAQGGAAGASAPDRRYVPPSQRVQCCRPFEFTSIG